MKTCSNAKVPTYTFPKMWIKCGMGGIYFPKDEDENMLQCNLGGINFLGGACNETLPPAPPPCITVILTFDLIYRIFFNDLDSFGLIQNNSALFGVQSHLDSFRLIWLISVSMGPNGF